MARAWAETIGNSDERISAARCFTARAINHYADRLFLGHRSSYLTPPSEEFVKYELNSSVSQLADAIGEAAVALPAPEASYLVSATYTVLLPEQRRALLGSYYTPPLLVDRLIDMATDAGVDWKSCRVLDPACGGGAFLSPVAARMVEALHDCEPAILLSNISNRLQGFEIDSFAAWTAQAFLEISLAPVSRMARQRLPQVVKVCDSLESVPHGPGFDLTIGNPPYGRVSLSDNQRLRYKRSLFGHANLYGLFTDLALRWSAPKGIVAYVTPTSFLAGEYFKALRNLIAEEAPPTGMSFVEQRSGVFEDVLQETLLATYRRGGSIRQAKVHCIVPTDGGKMRLQLAGKLNLPSQPDMPWMLPRARGDAALIDRLVSMPTRLRDWGYCVSTGPLVWNRHKDQLKAEAGKGRYPLIWAEAVTSGGRFVLRSEKRNHVPYFAPRDGDDWLMTRNPCVLVQRTTAKEQHRRLIAAELPADLIKKCHAVVIENHLNMIKPTIVAPKVTPAAVAVVLNSEIADKAFRCISGSVAVSAFELEALPLPSIDQMKTIEKLIQRGRSIEIINRSLEAIYSGEEE